MNLKKDGIKLSKKNIQQESVYYEFSLDMMLDEFDEFQITNHTSDTGLVESPMEIFEQTGNKKAAIGQLQKKMEAKKDVQVKCQQEAMNDIWISNSEKLKTDLKEVSVEIKKQDLLLDNYKLSYMDENGITIKQISILVMPLDLVPTNGYAVPIIAVAKCGKEMKAFATENASRPSIPISINGEFFIVRGSYNTMGFQTFLYPQNTSEYNLKKELKVVRPNEIRNFGHNFVTVEKDGIHIFPLSICNNINGQVSSLILIEKKSNKFYQLWPFLHNNCNVIEKYDFSISWENDKLFSGIKRK